MKQAKKQAIKDWMKARLAERDDLAKKQNDAFRAADRKNAKYDRIAGFVFLAFLFLAGVFVVLLKVTGVEACGAMLAMSIVFATLGGAGWIIWFMVRYVRFLARAMK